MIWDSICNILFCTSGLVYMYLLVFLQPLSNVVKWFNVTVISVHTISRTTSYRKLILYNGKFRGIKHLWKIFIFILKGTHKILCNENLSPHFILAVMNETWIWNMGENLCLWVPGNLWFKPVSMHLHRDQCHANTTNHFVANFMVLLKVIVLFVKTRKNVIILVDRD